MFKYNPKIKFLVIGVYNTAFSLIIGNLAYYFIKLPYAVIAVIVYVISVSNSYFSYELFLFKTRQKLSKGLLKANITYLGTFLLNLALMFVFINIFGIDRVLAFNIVSVIVVVVLYFLHKHFTFAGSEVDASAKHAKKLT